MESFNPYHSYNMQPDNVIYNKISSLVGQVGGGGEKLKENLKQQPHLQNLVVAVQPSSATSPSVLPQGQPQNIRDWNSGLCGCCEDCCSCK